MKPTKRWRRWPPIRICHVQLPRPENRNVDEGVRRRERRGGDRNAAAPLATVRSFLEDMESPRPAQLQSALTDIVHAAKLFVWQKSVPAVRDVWRAGRTGPGAAAWLLAFPGATHPDQPSLAWPGDTFRTAVQLHLGAPITVLSAAGLTDQPRRCWMRHVPDLAVLGRHADASVAPEEGMPVGSIPPSTQACRAAPATRGTDGITRCGDDNHLVEPTALQDLLVCRCFGLAKRKHDAISHVLASIAPVAHATAWPGPHRLASARHDVIQNRVRDLAPGRADWPVPDVDRDPAWSLVDLGGCQSSSTSESRAQLRARAWREWPRVAASRPSLHF